MTRPSRHPRRRPIVVLGASSRPKTATGLPGRTPRHRRRRCLPVSSAYLDHGAEYLKHGRKDEAAVIAGIVFEDTVRRICRVLGLPEERGRAHNGTWEAGCYDRAGGEAA
jgi:hypothetical protein